MNSLLPETSNLVYALGWALIHSLWQALLVYVLLRVVLRYLPASYASARYYSAVSAIGITIGWFIITLAYEYNTVPGFSAVGSSPVSFTPATVAVSGNSNSASFVSGILSWYNAHTQLVVTLYICGIALLLFRLVYNLLTLKNLKNTGIIPPDGQWLCILDKCLDTLQISRQVQLLFSSKVTVPMVMGSIKPVILVPVAIANQMTIQEAEAILLHELAHVRRNDYLINIIQMFIETVLFYNPFVWLISSVIRKEREHCCDDIVVMKTNDRLPYAKALAALETYRLYPAPPALAATGSKNLLLTRIKRIMEMKNNNIKYGQLTVVLLVIVLLLTSVALIIPQVNAQSKKDKKEQPATGTKTKTTFSINNQVVTITDDKGNKKTYTSINAMPADEKKELEDKLSESFGSVLANSAKGSVVIYDDNGKKDVAIVKKDGGKIDIVDYDGTETDIDRLVSNAMSLVDWDKISKTAIDTLDKVDRAAIEAEVKQALKESKEEMKAMAKKMRMAEIEIAKADKEMRLADIEMAKADKEMRKADREMRLAEKEMANAKNLSAKEMADARREVTIARTGHNKAIIDAHKEIAEAQKRIAEAQKEVTREMAHAGAITKNRIYSSHDKILEAMEKDGLINRKKGFEIEKKGNELYIDGIRQSKEVFKKYELMMDVKNLSIKGNSRSIKMTTDD